MESLLTAIYGKQVCL